MRTVLLVSAMVLAVSACGGKGNEEPSAGTASAQEQRANVQSEPAIDAAKPSSEFLTMDGTVGCLGVYATVAGEAGIKEVAKQYSSLKEPELFGSLDGFALADHLTSVEGKAKEWVSPYVGNSYYVLDSTKKTGQLLDAYDFETLSFAQRSAMVSHERGVRTVRNGQGMAACSIEYDNLKTWGGRYTVTDPNEARLVDQARRDDNLIIKVYAHADSARLHGAFPGIQASVLRVEFTDKQGNILATPDIGSTTNNGDQQPLDVQSAIDNAASY